MLNGRIDDDYDCDTCEPSARCSLRFSIFFIRDEILASLVLPLPLPLSLFVCARWLLDFPPSTTFDETKEQALKN